MNNKSELLDMVAKVLNQGADALDLAAKLQMHLTIGQLTCFATAMVPECPDGLVIGCGKKAEGENDSAMVRRCIAECATAYARRQP